MDPVKISELQSLGLEDGDKFVVTYAWSASLTVGKAYETFLDDSGTLSFKNDNNYTWSLASAIESEGYIVRDNVFKVGDDVQISVVGRGRHVDLNHNPHNTVGTIIEDRGADYHSRYRYRVDWPCGYNSYRPEDLELVARPVDDGDVEGDTDLLTNRGSTHGDFSESSIFVQGLKTAMRETPNWDLLNADQKEALEMIVHKMGRALFGQPHFKDHWDDISGYSTLVSNRLT